LCSPQDIQLLVSIYLNEYYHKPSAMLRNEHQNYDCSLDELWTTDTVAVWTLPGHRIDHRRQAPFHHPYPEDEDDDLLNTPPPQHCDMKTKLRIYILPRRNDDESECATRRMCPESPH